MRPTQLRPPQSREKSPAPLTSRQACGEPPTGPRQWRYGLSVITRLIRILSLGLSRSASTRSSEAAAEGDVARKLLATLERRSYLTYMGRLRASNRLAFRNRAWNATLIAASGAVTVASVALLVYPDIYGRPGPTLLVLVSILALIASLVTSSLNYSARSRDMFRNYRRIQALSAEVERTGRLAQPTLAIVEELNRRYDALLDESENHTTADHKRVLHEIAQREGKEPRPLWRQPLVVGQAAASAAPYVSLAVPILVLVPLISWIIGEAGR